MLAPAAAAVTAPPVHRKLRPAPAHRQDAPPRHLPQSRQGRTMRKTGQALSAVRAHSRARQPWYLMWGGAWVCGVWVCGVWFDVCGVGCLVAVVCGVWPAALQCELHPAGRDWCSAACTVLTRARKVIPLCASTVHGPSLLYTQFFVIYPVLCYMSASFVFSFRFSFCF